MPIDKEEFESGRMLSEVEKAIVIFLKGNPTKAFSMSEISEGVNLKTNFKDFWNAVFSVMGMMTFQSVLNDLVRLGKIKVNIINGTYYYMTNQ
jgi:hypothetical protein